MHFIARDKCFVPNKSPLRYEQFPARHVIAVARDQYSVFQLLLFERSTHTDLLLLFVCYNNALTMRNGRCWIIHNK